MGRVAVFIDGFNLFYSLKAAKAKWLDIARLVDSLPIPGNVVTQIHYFTAIVDGVDDPDRPLRQQQYLKAIGLDPRVKVHLGTFLTKTIDRPLERLSIANNTCHLPMGPQMVLPNTYDVTDSRGFVRYLPVYNFNQNVPTRNPFVFARVHTKEEKGSDVNLAVQMLHRAWLDEYDQAIVISNDSDLCEPIKLVKNHRGKEVTLCFVRQKSNVGVSTRLQAAASGVLNVKWSTVRRYQFPNTIPLPSGQTINKPPRW